MSGPSFTGRIWDSEISLLYYRARYYDPSSARFVSDDPAGLAAGTNLVSYVFNRSLSLVDPFGLCGDQNQFDRSYAQMIQQQKEPSKLDKATPDIKRRAHAMGEPETYLQLGILSAAGGSNLAGEFTDLLYAKALEQAAKHPEIYAAIVDFIMGRYGPPGPVGNTIGQQAAQVAKYGEYLYDQYVTSHYRQEPDHWQRLKKR